MSPGGKTRLLNNMMTPELNLSRDIILACHSRFAVATTRKERAALSFICGAEYLRAKNAISHGTFGDWCEQNLSDISIRQLQRHADDATRIRSKVPVIPLTAQQIAAGSLPPSFLDALYAAALSAGSAKLPLPRTRATPFITYTESHFHRLSSAVSLATDAVIKTFPRAQLTQLAPAVDSLAKRIKERLQ